MTPQIIPLRSPARSLVLLGVMLSVTACLRLSANNATDPGKFLNTYCFECHGETKQKADRRFDDLPTTITSWDDLERYQEIVDQLNLSQMPPKKASQPAVEERAAVIDLLTTRIATAREHLDDARGHTVLRRLNTWEYRQTIGDLLGLNVELWDPSDEFPEETKVHGFDNNGASLVTSGLLLGHYFNAAEEAIRRATHFGDRPEFKRYRQTSPFYFSGRASRNLPKLFQVDRFRFIPETPYTDLYGRHYRGGHIGFAPLVRQQGVTHSGIYTLRVKAAAVGRHHDYGDAVGDFRNGDPLVLELAAVDRRGSVTSTGNVSKMISLARVELTSETPAWLEWEVYLEAGYEPEIRFRNGPLAAKRLVRLLSTRAGDKDEIRPFANMKNGMEKAHGILKAYRGPRLRIWEIQLEGPHIETWPPEGHRALYNQLQVDELNPETIAERISAFATQAFRRPSIESELAPIQSLVAAKLKSGMEPLAALKLGFQTLLCSPGFLFLNHGEGVLEDHALASRLSYFLWSSQPDQSLRDLVSQGTLKENLDTQVTRMMADRKSDRFIRHFVRTWLELDQIGTMPPSSKFLEYYRDNLEVAMRDETERFFRHLLDENLPLDEFLTADYSFLNRELALHYGIQGVEGNDLKRVSFPNSRRGGLLGQGTFLTASANGVDTSPVIRGIYVLEKLLGMSPASPPPDVPEIEPDIRGAVSLRDQLEKHRASPTCSACHEKIDPLGFALENFDAVGGWRQTYENRTPIDSSGHLPNGDTFSNLEEFRDSLVRRHDQFNRNLTEKLLTYALGRELGISDRSAVDQILSELKHKQGGLQDLVRLVVLSQPFGKN